MVTATRDEVFPITIPAIKGKPNADEERLQIFTVELPAKATGEFYAEAATNIEGGFQRPLNVNRANKIGRLMTSELPNIHSGLLAYAEPDQVEYDTRKHSLTIKEPLRFIDGQHRGAGAHYAAQHGTDYTDSVRIIVGADRHELAMWYLRSNIEQRKVGPGNIITNVAGMQGVAMRRKSWVARMVVALAKQPPFTIDEGGDSLVSFGVGRGKVAAATLYRATDALLPPSLNVAGRETEAIRYVHKAWSLYSELVPNWGTVEGSDFIALDAYLFTMMTGFARFYALAKGDEALVTKGWRDAGFAHGLPAELGSGERAATALAAFAAAKAGLDATQLST